MCQSNAGEYQLGKYFRKYAGEISMWNSGNLKYVRFELHTFLTSYELQMISFDC